MVDTERERWRRVEDLFERALALPVPERRAFLEKECGEDGPLKEEVASLLESSSDTTYLEPPSESALRATFAPPLPAEGTEIGNLEIRKRLAEGGMGVVFEGYQPSLKRRVAVKFLKSPFGTGQARERFLWEARVLAQFHHDCIARVFESGIYEVAGSAGLPYFVMEFVEGARPLDVFAARVPLDQALPILAEAADAVHYGHARGVIHRDLKPANILVDAQGRPKIIDYGIARDDTASEETRGFETATGLLIGTPRYMSPEQLRGAHGLIDVRSDVYSLGVAYFEILVGRHPYFEKSLSWAEAVEMLKDREPVRPSKWKPGIPADLEAVLLRAVALRPEERYASAAALAEDLRRVASGEPVSANPPTWIRQVRHFARRRRGVFVASLIALGSLITSTIVSLLFAFERDRALTRESERSAELDRLLQRSSRFGDWVISDLQPKLTSLPNSTALRKDVLLKVLEYLDALALDAGENKRLKVSIARGFLSAGMVQGAPSYSNLGLVSEARKSFETAERLFLEAYGPEPKRPIARGDLAIARIFQGEIDAVTGRLDSAAEAYDSVIPRFKELILDHPEPAKMRELLGKALRGKAVLFRQQGALRDAAAASREAFSVRLDASKEGTDESADSLIAEAGATAYDLMAIGLFDEAQSVFDAAAPAVERLKTKERPQDSVDGLLSQFFQARADLGLRQEKLADAKSDQALALAAAERQVEKDRRDASRQFRLVSALGGMAEIAEREGDGEAALSLRQRHLGVLRDLSERDPRNREMRQHLAFAKLRVGRLLGFKGDFEEALALLKEAKSATEILGQEHPKSPYDQHVRVDAAEALPLAEEQAARSADCEEGDRLRHLQSARENYRALRSLLDTLPEDSEGFKFVAHRKLRVDERLKALDRTLDRLER